MSSSSFQCPPLGFAGKYYSGDGCVRQSSFFEGKAILSQGVGYSVILGFGAFFAVFTSFLVWLEKRYVGSQHTSEWFNTAGRNVKTGLIASVIVSQWTWLLQYYKVLMSPGSTVLADLSVCKWSYNSGIGALALDLPITATAPGPWTCPSSYSYGFNGKGRICSSSTMLFMAVTSAGSSELIAVSSLCTYDIYRTYINPNATGKQILRVSRGRVQFRLFHIWAVIAIAWGTIGSAVIIALPLN
ncbi:hypothetical protein GIB67_020161 [Kingdonia uniflora]|uniref:Uncharacterized protein n=1 Tax=Kingdonia uniflora TaxID=39325 RepID=A0A7J7M6F3_9MAGN|nr:hypothetical protein GIB67_020161 [Kingdonia uniflora]